MRREFLNPIFERLLKRLATSAAVQQAFAAIDGEITATAVRGIPIHLIEEALGEVNAYHRRRLISSFRSALGLDIRPLINDRTISGWMKDRISDNVDLIKTIPERAHAGLKRRMEKQFFEDGKPFDQAAMRRMLAEEYRSSGYNLRRLTRDQTSKQVGQLTEIRHRQLNIRGYQWLTSQDERVRPAHRQNSGKFYLWDKPPLETGHPGFDIQCRCSAIPAVTEADKARLAEQARP